MSSSTTTHGRSDAHTLSQLSDAHGARERFQDQRSALGQRGAVVVLAGAAQPELVQISQAIESLGRKIDTLRAALSPSGAMIYRALSRNNRLPFTSHVANGVCGACNMRVPSTLAASVISRGKSEQCPSCARLLLAEGDATAAAVARG
jgi:predicted  nucleic acid-binding Zn-ribbon protein